MRSVVVGCLVVAACSGGKDTSAPADEADTDTDTDADSDTDTDTDTDSDTDADTDADADIPDPYAGIDSTACEGPYVDNTMTAWFVGDVTVDGSTFSGTETAVVHWSKTMAAGCSYAPDCTMVWAVEGTVVDPVSCPSCTYSLVVDATYDPVFSDCDPDRVGDIQPDTWSSQYDVLLAEDGTTRVFFSASGSEWAGWYWAGDRVTYVSTDPYCFPYPDILDNVCP